jgi:Holliday junction resolvase RusA-like endonuclease
MPSIKVVVPGRARPKAVGFAGKGRGGYNHTPVKNWMKHVTETTKVAMMLSRYETAPAGTPVALTLDIWLPWAKGTSKKQLREDPTPLHVQTPDTDNLLKAIKDAVGKAGAWDDDCQVAQEYVEKRRCLIGDERVEIAISW